MSKKQMDCIIRDIFDAEQSVRYVALLQDDVLTSAQRQGICSASASESDRYEELLVNPTLLTAVRQRGNIDCGGLRFVVVAYGNFFQLVRPYGAGHISVCVDIAEDPIRVEALVERILQQHD